MGGGTGRNQGRGGGETAAADERSSEADRRVVFPVWRCWSHVEEVEGRLRKASELAFTPKRILFIVSQQNVYSVLYLAGEQQYSTLCSLSAVSEAPGSVRCCCLLFAAFIEICRVASFDVVLVLDTHASDLILQQFWKCYESLPEMTG